MSARGRALASRSAFVQLHLPTPAELNAELQGLLSLREVRATVSALQAAGSQAMYLAVDVHTAARDQRGSRRSAPHTIISGARPELRQLRKRNFRRSLTWAVPSLTTVDLADASPSTRREPASGVRGVLASSGCGCKSVADTRSWIADGDHPARARVLQRPASSLGLATLALLVSACATPAGSSSGAGFNATVSTPRVGALELTSACWPQGASGTVTFSRAGDRDLRFEATPPSLNPTARCQREVLLTAPDGLAAVGSGLTVSPPQGPSSGWVVLAWARLLNEGRYGPEKGLLDAAPLVRACLAQGMGLRGTPTFTVDPEGQPRVQVVSESGTAGAVTDTERCVEAVLGSAAWPNSRAQRFRFSGTVGAPAPKGDVAPWFGGAGPERSPLDPAAVKEALGAHKAEIFSCWEQAIARRPELQGGRSVRLRASPDGSVTQVTVVGNLTDARSMPGDYLFDQCVVGVVSRTRFPQAGESVYSWNFAL